VSADTVDIAPPASAKVVDLGTLSPSGGGSQGTASTTTGLADVQAAVSFPVTAPDSLAGLQRQDVRLAGGSDSSSTSGSGSKTAIVVYGEGLGSIVVVERAADAGSKSPLAGLPAVSLGDKTAHELATPLGSAIQWTSNGVSLTLAGSVTSATAEAAARELG
jgi:hypothetical protein